MIALLASMVGIVVAIAVQLKTPANAFLYIINASLVGGMISWLVSLAAHVRFRATTSPQQLAQLGIRSPLGAAGSILGFIAVVGTVACTWWVSQSSVAAKSAVFYLLILSAAYWLVTRFQRGPAGRQN